MKTYKLRYSVVDRGVVLARKTLRLKAETRQEAMDRATNWLCSTGLAFKARLTSLKSS